MASHNVTRPVSTIERTEQERQEEQAEIHAYRKLEELVWTKIAEKEYTAEVLELTSKLIKKNPEYYSIWNARRRLLMHGLFSKSSGSSLLSTESPSTLPLGTTTLSSEVSSSCTATLPENNSLIPTRTVQPAAADTTLNLIRSELEFLFPIMVKWPKCYWLWNYRIWLLHEAKARLDLDIAREMWQRELILVGKMLVRDSRNFHGWGYRRQVVSELESPSLDGSSMVEAEFEYTTRMIHGDKGLSNFSAWHRRSKLISRLLDERRADDAARRKFLDDEFDLIISAMYTDSYPYAQSAWFYYQFLMTTLTNPIGHATITPNFTNKDRTEYVTRQLANLTDMLDGAEDCKWIYSALIEYTLSLGKMENRPLGPHEKQDCQAWLAELRSQDPDRSGRWDDLETSLNQ